jgi:antitoxin component of RelBE/YafQ-DinJ toxin-antitoxin module
MSELLDQLATEIALAKDLPLDQQPAAFELIRQKLESMIADARSETKGPEEAE